MILRVFTLRHLDLENIACRCKAGFDHCLNGRFNWSRRIQSSLTGSASLTIRTTFDRLLSDEHGPTSQDTETG